MCQEGKKDRKIDTIDRILTERSEKIEEQMAMYALEHECSGNRNRKV